ncbi:MAG: DUF4864 domain-containing protein [Pelagimonas sp.]|uniref:DUF4864 domain-containing protein n=1 Tax=Pelagimonas sp. TaxID=2073170 RepID=UPI003D6B1C2F
MKTWIIAFVISMVAGIAASQDIQAQNRAIETTIQNQVEAFQNNDFAAGFEFASPSLQTLFGTAENFGAMVRNGYPMVWKPQDLRFGELRLIDGALWQNVLVTDQESRVFSLDYKMIKVDGSWRIAAVQLIPIPDMTV